MKQLLKIILLLVVFSGPVAKAQMTSYKEIYDDPLAYHKLFINLRFFDIDFGQTPNFRLGVGAEFMLNKRLWFSADVAKGLNFFGVDGAVKKSSVLTFEGGAVFNYFARVTKGKVVYSWKEDHTQYKFKIDGKVLRTAGVRAGMYLYGSPKDLGNYKAYFNSDGVYAGIIFGVTRNKRIDAADIASRHTVKETKGVFYIDAMFSPLITYSDNTDYSYVDGTTNNLNRNVNLDTMVTKNYIGARFGWLKTFRYPIPMQYGFEFGARPGLQKNYYALIRFAVALGFIRKSSPGEVK